MKIVSKKVGVEEITLTLSDDDLQIIGKWQGVLSSATKENAQGLAKDFAGELERLLQFLTELQLDKIASARIVEDEKTQDKHVRNGKCQSKQTTQRGKIKVTITNIDDNNVFQTVVRMLGRFVKCGDCMSIESQLRKDKGVIYLDNEQELNDLLDTLLAYNLSDNVTPIKIQVE